jgi:Arc/MetJ family transcription regulator
VPTSRSWQVTAEVYHAAAEAPEDEYAYDLAFKTVIALPGDVDLLALEDSALEWAVRSRLCNAVWDEQRQQGLGRTHIGTIQNIRVESV